MATQVANPPFPAKNPSLGRKSVAGKVPPAVQTVLAIAMKPEVSSLSR